MKFNLASGFSIVAHDFPIIRVPGELCIYICKMPEIIEWRKTHSDNALSTKIVDIILRDGPGRWMTVADVDRIVEIRKRSDAADAMANNEQTKNSALVQTIAKEILTEIKEHYMLIRNGPWVGEREDPQRIIELCLAKIFPQSAMPPDDEELQRRTAAATKVLSSLSVPKKRTPKAIKFPITGLRQMKSPDGREFL